MLKQVMVGGTIYILPFRASGFWVEDAKGLNVCSCRTMDIAKALATLLNETNRASD
jgi:hypothetical protein